MVTKYILHRTIFVVIALRLVLYVTDGLPTLPTLWGVGAHCVYLVHLRTFPFLPLLSLQTAASIVALVGDHYMWFSYFSSAWYPFAQVSAYFGFCVWMVPFIFFISSSANDAALPLPNANPARGGYAFAPTPSSSSSPSHSRSLVASLLAYPASLLSSSASFSSSQKGAYLD